MVEHSPRIFASKERDPPRGLNEHSMQLLTFAITQGNNIPVDKYSKNKLTFSFPDAL